MSRIRTTFTNDVIKSNAHTVIVTDSAQRPGTLDVEVSFFAPTGSVDRAVDMAFESLGLEDFAVTTKVAPFGYMLTCSFAYSTPLGATHEDAYRFVCQHFHGTPAWRAVLSEMERFANGYRSSVR